MPTPSRFSLGSRISGERSVIKRTTVELTTHYRWATTSTYGTVCWAETRSRISSDQSCKGGNHDRLTTSTSTWSSDWQVVMNVRCTARTLCRQPLCWSWTLITTTSLHLKMTVTPSQTLTMNCVLSWHLGFQLLLLLSWPPVQEHPPRAQTPPPILDVTPPVAPPVPQPRRSRRLAGKNNWKIRQQNH